MFRNTLPCLLLAAASLLAARPATAQDASPQASDAAPASTGGGVRSRIRTYTESPPDITEEQAEDLTLTLVSAEARLLQVWVRTAGAPDATGRTLTACARDPNADLVAPGQRVRAFSPDTKSSMFQARVVSVTAPDADDDCTIVRAEISGPLYEDSPRYVMEIVVDRGAFFTIPNEAIIEEGDRQIVYWAMHPGHYVPTEIRTGLRGELYSEVLEGLNPGDQVVTIGSFFIDADAKIRSTGGAAGHAHQHH